MTCTCGGQFCLCCGTIWQEFWEDCRSGCPKYEAPVYDADGYNQNGYNPNTGRDRNGVHWTTNNPDVVGPEFDEDGFDGDGWDREGYDRDGFDDWGFNREGRDREGYDARGYDIHLFDRTGHDKAGVPRSSYPDHDENGGFSFNIFGYDQEGYNRQGYDTEGYDYDGFNQSGFNRNGLNIFGFSRHHRDPNGNIEPGFRLVPDGNVQRDHLCTGWGCCAQLQALSPNGNSCAACRLMFREGERPDYVHWGDVPVCAACTMEGFGYLSSLSVWERAGFLGLAEMIGRLELGEDYEIDAAQIERRADHGW
ncbi:hypothetical protein CKM354_000119100 [Cercospora kikuchii]|uniref:Uncharacterized protein n=1 Tax=Cercospora kikuchii TaxID=84275 RepID=A0A9P3FCQ4_9PEZI|nr:uncharacterized protein CKM354_000119100 [Cercospora kikuchii]GIZ37755.1 hypothetical protein CKM354_000119100 [Cercospora kikuchii]